LLLNAVPRFGLHDGNVAQCTLRDFSARHLHKTLLAFKADDSAAWADALGEQAEDTDWPAANIGRSPHPRRMRI
jgi:hypothetical protein